MLPSLERTLQSVWVRCQANVALEQLSLVLLGSAGAVGATVLVERLFSLRVISWPFFAALSAGAMAATVALWLRRRPSRMEVAILIDRELGWRERMSTALALAKVDPNDPFVQAAQREIGEASRRLTVHGRFPVRPTRRWWYSGSAWVGVLLLALLMPTLDLFGRQTRTDERRADAAALAAAQAEVQQALSVVRSTVQQLNDPQMQGELERLSRVSPDARQPEQVRREAIRRLGDLSDRLRERMETSPQMSTARAMQAQMRGLQSLQSGPASQLSQALNRSDFRQAAEAVRQLQQQMQSGQTSPEDRERLAQQLQELSRQLEAMGQRQQEAEDALAEAGLDRQLAQLSPEQLRRALQQQANLTPEQIEQLLQKAAACQAAAGQCRGLAAAMGQCSAAAGAGGAGGAGGGGGGGAFDELGEQLSDMEMMMAELQAARASLSEMDRAIQGLGQGNCQGEGNMPGGGGVGPWQAGNPANRPGGGTGGPGHGYGGRDTSDPMAVGLDPTKVPNTASEGPTIARYYLHAEQVRGESTREASEVVRAAADRAAEAIEDHQIPRQYEAAVKRYFGAVDPSARTE